MAGKVSALLCSFLLAILLVPSLTSAGELLQIPQVHTAGGGGIAKEALKPYRTSRPDKPAIGGRPGQPYTRGKPYYGPSPPNNPTPNPPGKPYHRPSDPKHINFRALAPNMPPKVPARPCEPYYGCNPNGSRSKPINPTPYNPPSP